MLDDTWILNRIDIARNGFVRHLLRSNQIASDGSSVHNLRLAPDSTSDRQDTISRAGYI